MLALAGATLLTAARSEPIWSIITSACAWLEYHPRGDGLMGGPFIDPAHDRPIWRATPISPRDRVSLTVHAAAWLFVTHTFVVLGMLFLYAQWGCPRLLDRSRLSASGCVAVSARSFVWSAALAVPIPACWYVLWIFWGVACEPMRGDTTVQRTVQLIAVSDGPTLIVISMVGALAFHAMLVGSAIRRATLLLASSQSDALLCVRCSYPLGEGCSRCAECGRERAKRDASVFSLGSRLAVWSATSHRFYVVFLMCILIAALLTAPRLSMLALNAVPGQGFMGPVGSAMAKSDAFILRLMGYI